MSKIETGIKCVSAAGQRCFSACPTTFNLTKPSPRDVCAGELICVDGMLLISPVEILCGECGAANLLNCSEAFTFANPLYDAAAVVPTAVVIPGGTDLFVDLTDVAAPYNDDPTLVDAVPSVKLNGYTRIVLVATATSKPLGFVAPGHSALACDARVKIVLNGK